ncbi:MAG: hypothetical protein DRN57_00670 [Thermoplasmata archaeon]|nr:MAG: hypothetical protein DRN57_00670 [Thermoplasmata archaeon]
MSEFERCLKERRLLKMESSDKMIEKELEGARYDLMRAEESMHNGDYKWSSVQAYYSLFHAAKALVSKGAIEKKVIIVF